MGDKFLIYKDCPEQTIEFVYSFISWFIILR